MQPDTVLFRSCNCGNSIKNVGERQRRHRWLDLLGRSKRPIHLSPLPETLPDYSSRPFDRPAFMVRVGSRKLSRYRRNGTLAYEYYDLATGPQERRNLFVEGKDGIADLRRWLDEYENASQAASLTLARASKQAAQGSNRVHLDPAQEEKLRALGYLK